MTTWSVMRGALRHEFSMQLRRPAVWVVLALCAALVLPLWALWAQQDLTSHLNAETHAMIPPDPLDAILTWVMFFTWLVPVGVGLVLADRLARDRSTRVNEVLDTLPRSLGARLLGKYVGATLATLLPVALIYTAVILYVMARVPRASEPRLAAAAFAAVVLPAVLFVSGFSIAMPAVLKVPVYQFLFIGYWFWANLLPPKLGFPSLIGTMLNATGPWAFEGLFSYQWVNLRLHATAANAYTSIALLSGLGVAAICGAWGYARYMQARR
jgi:ABC-2 type transport system permease protein